MSSFRFSPRAAISVTRPVRRRRRAWVAEALENRTLLSTFTVSDLSGDPADPNSLPHAVAQANLNPGSMIQFQSGLSGTIPLSSTLELSADVTIVGPGANVLTVQGGGGQTGFRVFTVDSGVTTALSSVTVTGGNATKGGGINNSGTLTLTDCTVSGNAAGGNGSGGGIFNGGTMTLTNCTVSGNSSGAFGWPSSGGGIENSGGTLVLISSTVADNQSNGFIPFLGGIPAGSGGGISNDGGTVTLTDCTIAGNTATSDGGGIGNHGTTTLRNTIVAGNSSIYAGSTGDISGAVDPASAYNLIGKGGSGGLTNGVNHNIVGVDPLLGPLQDNGGPTQTMALLAGSPAIDAGSNALVPAGVTTDQRGLPRIVNGTVDIGAYESPVLITVSDLSGDPNDPGSLPHAVQQANLNPDSMIQFQSGLSGTIPLSSTLELSADVAIVGLGANVLTVKGGGSGSNFSVFTVDAGVTAMLSGLTITGGSAANGGGIDNSGTMTLTNSTVSGNSANGGDGGGILNTSTGTMTLTTCTVSGNTAFAGGGILNNGTMTLTTCTVSGNTASPTGYGGGILNGGTMTLTTCTVSGNTAFAISFFFPTGYGGGIDNDGTMTLTNCTVSGNEAGNTAASGGFFGSGGGIDNDGTKTLNNCTVSGNTANGGGGGIFNNGTMTLTNCTVSGNTANGSGGGIAVSGGTVTLRNSIVAGNVQQATPSAGTTPADIVGAVDPASASNLIGTGGSGGLTNGVNHNIVGADPRLGPLQDNGGPTQTMALLDFSPALNAGSNALVPPGITTDQRGLSRIVGGTVDIGAFESQTPVVASFVVDTTADEIDPADGKTSLREAIAFANMLPGHTITFDPAVFPTDGTTTIQLLNDPQHGTLELKADVTIAGPGAKALSVQGGGSSSNFSVITVDQGVTAVLSGLSVTGGHAASGGGITNAGTLNLTGCTVSGNAAGNFGISGGRGGGIANTGTMTLTGCTVSGNSGTSSIGGGISNTGIMTLTNSTVSGNSVSQGLSGGSQGGGISNAGTMTLTNSTVSSNSAGLIGGSGGGVNNTSTMTLTNCTVSDNTAGVGGVGGGGGIVNTFSGTMTLTNCTVSGNSTGFGSSQGGGISNAGTMTLTNSTVSSNSAGLIGGIAVSSGTVTLRNSIVAGNVQGNPSAGTTPADIVGAVDPASAYNLIGTGGAGGLTNGVNHNIVGANPGLLPLQDNGGPTQTMALVLGSPALEAGSIALIPPGLTTDQRGLPRVVNGTVDIGAYEAQPPIVPSFVVDTTADVVDSTDGQTSLREAIMFAWDPLESTCRHASLSIL